MTGTELRFLRLASGLSQSRAAEQCGVALRTFQHWEAGTRNIRAARARLALRVLVPKPPYPETQADLSRPEQQRAADTIKS